MATFSNTMLFQPVAVACRGKSCAERYRANRTPRERAITDRSGGGTPNHFGVRGRIATVIGLTDLVGGEHQIVADLLLREAQMR